VASVIHFGPKHRTPLSYARAMGKYGLTTEKGIYPEDVLKYYGAVEYGSMPEALGRVCHNITRASNRGLLGVTCIHVKCTSSIAFDTIEYAKVHAKHPTNITKIDGCVLVSSASAYSLHSFEFVAPRDLREQFPPGPGFRHPVPPRELRPRRRQLQPRPWQLPEGARAPVEGAPNLGSLCLFISTGGKVAEGFRKVSSEGGKYVFCVRWEEAAVY